MLFQTKKSKIRRYLDSIEQGKRTAFDELLEYYCLGTLKGCFEKMGIARPEIHIDWLNDYRCIGVQGRSGEYYIDLQIEPKEFTIACDADEPDDPAPYPLESVEQLASVVSETIRKLT